MVGNRSVSLSARDVVHRYPGVTALDGVSLDVVAGRSVALVGESGSGKSTLLRCFNRMVVPTAGVVRVDDVDVSAQSPEALRRSIGYVPQQGGLMPHWRVLRNVALVPLLRGMDDADGLAASALELVGLNPRQYGSRYPFELSGGQAQRVALARALAARPGVILLDEPFGALDALTRSDLQQAFNVVRKELDVTTLLVTHDLAEASRLADDLVVMRAGRVEQRGTLDDLFDAPATPYVAALLERAVAGSLRAPA